MKWTWWHLKFFNIFHEFLEDDIIQLRIIHNFCSSSLRVIKIKIDFTMKLIIHPISSKYLYFIALKCIFKQLIYGSIFQLAMYHAWHTTTFNQYKKKYYNNCLEAISFRVIYKITTLFNYNRLLQDYRSTCNFPFQDTVYTMLCITGCIGKEHFSNACHK